MSLTRQMSAFVLVGLFAVVAHYGALVTLVELFGWSPVKATLVGYLFGGVTSYLLNRRHTFISDRAHSEAVWRFALVAGVGFLMTWALMLLFVNKLGAPYLPAQLVTTGLVQFWSFLGNKLWTFSPG
ncbi:MAG: polysaccharide synthesis protein GtrA [Hyphomicrobiales bacterium]|nr:polysaccharide synthesis protein GtrA [Hyphomicrobiales bacterium]